MSFHPHSASSSPSTNGNANTNEIVSGTTPSSPSTIPTHFAIGDIITLPAAPPSEPERHPLMRRAGLAMFTAHIAALNIHACMVALESTLSPSGPLNLELLPNHPP